MDATLAHSAPSTCDACPARLVCRCLRVTEDAVVQAIDLLGLQTVQEVRCHTGAGDGCTACHRRLRKFLDQRQALPQVVG